MSEAKSFFIKLTKHGTGLIGLIIVLTIIAISLIVALTGSSLLPYDPIEQNVGEPMESPSLKHFFGTLLIIMNIYKIFFWHWCVVK